jgi:membrane-bound metal-dependent hydrolase YbcI (DUF457 family)
VSAADGGCALEAIAVMWHGHLAMAVASAEVTAPLVPHPLGAASMPAWCAIVGVFGLVPDLDHRNGKLSHSLGPITWLLCRFFVKLSKAVYFMTRGPRDFEHTNGHRALTHTPVFAAAAGVLAWALESPALGWFVGLAVLQGILAHIGGDACTNSGVPLLFPLKINGRRWGHYGLPRRMRFETGGTFGEPLVTVTCYVLCVAIPVGYLWLGVHLV